MSKICCFFNHPSHYRQSIYCLMEKELGCDFVFGDEVPSVKEMDCCLLSNVKRFHYAYLFNKVLYVKGVFSYLVKRYDTIIVTPATNSLTHWMLLFYYKLHPSKKIYFWTHGLYGNESRRQLFIKKIMLNNATGLFLYGNYAKQLMIKDGFVPSKLNVIYNSLNYDEQLHLRENIQHSSIYIDHFKNRHPVIIMIGRLNKRKNMGLLIDAILKMKENNKLVNVVVIGDGDEKSELIKKARECGIIDQIWFYGACYDETINAELIYNADLCVVPGDVGLTALHAMAFGVPVISHDYFPTQGPEFEIITPGVTGDFFKNDDAVSLSNIVSNWLTSKASQRENVRKECYNVVAKYWNPYYQIKVFKSVLGC